MKKKILAILISMTLIQEAYCDPPADLFGKNLLDNGGFQTMNPSDTVPAGWTVKSTGSNATVSADPEKALVEKNSLKISMPESGDTGTLVSCDPVSVTPGKRYLFSVAFRQEGMSVLENDHYPFKGVDAQATIYWLGSDDRLIKADTIGLPYGPCAWDFRDLIVEAPGGAERASINLAMSNNSLKTSGTNIPSIIWWDAVQLREYTPPVGESAAPQAQSQVFHPAAESSWSGMNGEWSHTVEDKEAQAGQALEALASGKTGLVTDSPQLSHMPAGLYRLKAKVSISETGSDVSIGYIDVNSQYAASRTILYIIPNKFSAAGQYTDIQGDFIVRDNGWNAISAYTEGLQKWKIDSIEIIPLVVFSQADLQQMFPSYDSATPEERKP